MIATQKTGAGNEREQALLKGRRILVADDSPAIRFVAAAALRSLGAIVQEVSDGIQAIAMVGTGAFDLVLMDVQMPRLDGIEATCVIRASGMEHLPIVALTGSNRAEQDACLSAGMDAVVQKPFTQSALVSQVISCLGGAGQLIDTRPGEIEAGNSFFSPELVNELFAGDTAFMKRMLSIAVQELPMVAQQMREAYTYGQMEHVGKLAHRIRPCISGLGIAALPEKLLQIEAMAAGTVNARSLNGLIAGVTDEMEMIARQIIKAQ